MIKLEESFANNITDRVLKAIDYTKQHERDYFDRTLRNRSGLHVEGRKGSYYPASPQEIETDLRKARWYGYTHPNVMPGFHAAAAYLPGMLGVLALEDLPESATFIAIDVHDRVEDTGFFDLLLEGSTPLQNIGHTVLILGQDDKTETEMMITFHPGDPIQPSELTVPKTTLKKGDSVTLAQAKAFGYKYTKAV